MKGRGDGHWTGKNLPLYVTQPWREIDTHVLMT